MAMRPRGGASGIRAAAGHPVFRRPVFEDFRPFSEWRHEEGADVLLIHLPGFMKENLKITSEPTNMIRVRGERMLANNTWSRFSQDFRIPDYCNVAGIRARFEAGILYITMAINSTPTEPEVATNDETQTPKTTTTETPKSSEEKMTKVGAAKTAQFEKDSAVVQAEMSARSQRPKSSVNDSNPSGITRKENATTPKASEIGGRTENGHESKTAEKVVMGPKPESSTEIRPTFKQKTTDLVEEVRSRLQKTVEDIKTSVAKSSAQKVEKDQINPENNTENITFKQKTTNLVEDVKSKLQKSTEDIKTSVAKSSAQKVEKDQTNPENNNENINFKQKTTNLVEDVKSKLQKSTDDIKTSVAKSSAQKIEQDQTNPTKGGYKATNAGTIDKEKESMKKINEDFTHEAEFLKKHLKKPENDNNDSSNSREEDIAQTGEKGENQLEKYKKIVAEFAMKIKDDRETVVNIGAAVLVLVSLGVYISYTTFGNVLN